MRKMLDPRSIAVIGASETEGSVGRTIMDNALASAGRTVYPVNPRRDTILGLPSYPSVGDIGAEIDLAMVATPAATVPDVLAQCAAAGVHGAIVVSAGFSETGKQGALLDDADPQGAARQPDARGRPQLPGHHPAHGGTQRVVPQHHARRGQHRAHLSERCAGYRHARLGDRRARRLLDVRLGGRHGRRRLRRPHRLPGRRRADPQHPHLHGDDRQRAPLHERGPRLRAQQADHRAQAWPLRRECPSGAVAHRLDGRRRRDLRGRIPPRRRRARPRGRRPVPRGSRAGLPPPASGQQRRHRHQRRWSRRHGHGRAGRTRRASRVPLGGHDGDAQRRPAAVLEPRQPDRRAGRRGQRPLCGGGAGVPRRRGGQRHPAHLHAAG